MSHTDITENTDVSLTRLGSLSFCVYKLSYGT